jgi:SHS2 domain-containing protein
VFSKERKGNYAIATKYIYSIICGDGMCNGHVAYYLGRHVMVRKPYEVFEHTADIGMHAFGTTLAELFVHAAQGMESLMVEPEQIRILTSCEVRAEGHDAISLLIAWLNELIFLFDTEYLLFRDFEIEAITETYVIGRASGEVYDRQRHALSSAIKAVTWHEAAIDHKDDGYQARIIFDL